jgi:hypothetical protein
MILLREAHAASPNSKSHAGADTPSWLAMMDEIICSEMLTRVWTGVLTAYDQVYSTHTTGPIGQSILIGHVEARNQVLRYLVEKMRDDRLASSRLNRIWRRTGRWTDLLLGYLVVVYDVSSIAPHPERAAEFGDDLRRQSVQADARRGWQLVLASLRSAFAVSGKGGERPGSTAHFNARIASSIFACMKPEWLDAVELRDPLWLARVGATTCKAEGMIDELLAIDGVTR